jgi:hypothetical protein
MNRHEAGSTELTNSGLIGRPQTFFLICGLLAMLMLLVLQQMPARAAQTSSSHNLICPMLEVVAQSNVLPLDFFVRVIWQESRFQSDAVGPVTRYGERAQGIAQFMPETAAESGLLDPFDPLQALPKSGAFLGKLRDEFGNLGLAAAAYNAGPQRVRDFLAGLRGLPEETRHYVLAVTGRPVEDWVSPTQEVLAQENQGTTISCDVLLSALRATPARATGSADLNVPSWCRDLQRPNTAACGSVHASEGSITLVGRLDRQRRAKMLRASFR